MGEKYFKILDLLEPLRQRFKNFGPIGTLATKISEFWTYWNPCVKDFGTLDQLAPLRQRFPDFQTPPPPAAPEEFSDPNLTPLPTHPGIKYVTTPRIFTPCPHEPFIHLYLFPHPGWIAARAHDGQAGGVQQNVNLGRISTSSP